MKLWMLTLLLGLAALSRAEHQIDFDPNLFTGSATPVAVYANIGFAAPGTPYLAQDLSGPSGVPAMYHAVWQYDNVILNPTPIQSYTIDYGCDTQVKTLPAFSQFYFPGVANPPAGPEAFNPMFCAIPNQPPTAFDLLSPADAALITDTTVQLDWADATDPDEDPLTYSLYVGPSPDGLTSLDPEYVGSDSGSPFTGDFDHTYYWTVTVTDGQDHVTAATSTRQFSIVTPNSPPVLDPIGDRSLFEDSSLDIYVWAADNDEDTVVFSVLSDTDQVTASVDGPVEWNDATLTLTPAPDFYGTAEITVTVDDGQDTDSETFTLTVNNTNDPPYPFDLLTPANGAVVSGRTLTLSWEAGSDPDPADEFYYSVYLAGSPEEVLDLEGEIASWIQQTSLEVTVEGPGPWYWTVITWDGSEASTGTTAFSFRSNLAPTIGEVSDQTFDEDGSATVQVVFDDPDGNLLSTEASSSEEQLSVSLEEIPAASVFMDLVLEPAANWYGTATVTLLAIDEDNQQTTLTLEVTVNPVADVPAAFSLLTPADGATLVPFPGQLGWEAATDADPEDTVTYTVYMSDDPQTVLQNPVEGGLLDPSLVVGGDPGGTYWWTVKADDGSSPSVWANETFSFTYDVTNNPPIFVTIGNRSMNEDTSINFVVTANDPEGDAVTFEAESSDPGVVVTWLPQRDSRWIILTPVHDWFGEATITVTATDEEGLFSEESFLLTVININDRPTVSEFNMYTLEDTPAQIPWEGADVDGDSLIVESFMSPITVGQVVGDTYIPPADFNGFDAFLYRVFDGILYSDWTAVQVVVEAVNDNPLLDLPGVVNTNEDEPLVLDFTQYMSDIDQDSLVITVAEPTDLLVTIDGYTVTIAGPENWSGSETLTFTVDDRALRLTASDDLTVNVIAVNDAPTAADLAVTVPEDGSQAYVYPVADTEGSALTVTVDSGPFHGQLSGAMYFPDTNFFGSDSLSYHANDGELDSEVAWVRFTVTPVNDAPVADSQNLITDEETALAITFTGSDVENDPLTFSVVTLPLHGSFLAGVYTPVADFFGMDSLSFVANDGQLDSAPAWVHIQVANLDDCPIQITPFEDVVMAEPDEDTQYTITAEQIVAHFTDPDGDPITSTDVAVAIPADFNGTLPVAWSVSSGECTLEGSFDLIVEPRNDEPSWALCGVECGEVDDLEAFAAAWPSAGLTLGDIDGDSLTVVWFVNDEMVCSQAFGSSADCAAFCLDLTPYIEDPQDITVYFEIHDDSTVVNADGELCSWFLGFLDVDGLAMPEKFYLAPNHPNPFNPSTTVTFGITREQRVRAEVFNLRGQRVAVLADGALPAGHHQVVWNAGNAASGMYVLVLSAEEGVEQRKMMLVR